jgi:hypothetical protein
MKIRHENFLLSANAPEGCAEIDPALTKSDDSSSGRSGCLHIDSSTRPFGLLSDIAVQQCARGTA